MADFDLKSASPTPPSGGFDLASASPSPPSAAPQFDLASASSVSGGSSHITEDPDDPWAPQNTKGKSVPDILKMRETQYWPTLKKQFSEGMSDTSRAIDDIFHSRTWTGKSWAAFRAALETGGTLLTPLTAGIETGVGGPLETFTEGLLPKDKNVNDLLSTLEGSIRHSELDPFGNFKGDTPLTTKAGAIPKDITSTLVQLAIPASKPAELERVLAATGTKAAEALTENSLAVSARQILAPGTVDEGARATASTISARWAAYSRATDQAQAKMDEFGRVFGTAPEPIQLDFLHRMERGQAQATGQLTKASETFRTLLDERYNEVKARGIDIQYRENYVPHQYKKESRDAFLASNARSPLLGSKEFLKARRIDFLSEAMEKGLVPVTTNPIDLVTLRLRSMDRLIHGTDMINDLKQKGVVEFVKAGKPAREGLKPINDPLATVQYMNDAGERVIAGHYMAPEGAARVINNFLSASDIGNKDPIKWIRTVGNLANMVQLGLSAFHGGFVTMDSITAKNALAIQQLSRGEITRSLSNAVAAPFAPVTGLVKGTRLRNAWLNPEAATPELRLMAEMLQEGGGRISMPKLYQATPAGSFWKSFKNGTFTKEVGQTFKDHPWSGIMELSARAVETSNSWLMEYYVPRQKLGVAYDMIADAIRRNPGMSATDLRATMQGIVDSTDNRMGQLIYDNLHWNKTMRDSMHLGIRAVGWNLGTIREFGGGAWDAARDLDKFMKTGEWEGIGRRTAYIFSTVATTAALSASLQYLYTGKGPQMARDYFFPRTGAKDPKYGYDERISLPTYVKDLDSYNRDPLGTMASKIHPMWGDMWSVVVSNRDFFGAAIRDPQAPWQNQVKDLATFLGDQYTPFTWRKGSKKRSLTGDPEVPFTGGRVHLEQFFGIQRAPLAVASPETSEALKRKYDEIPALKKKAKEEARGDR